MAIEDEGIVKQILRKLTGTLGFALCAVGILGFLVASFGIDYIEEEMKECETLQGEVAQWSGADDGDCDKGREIRDLLVLIRYPLLIAGIICGLVAAKVF